MIKFKVVRNFGLAVLAAGFLAACAQTKADTGLSNRVDMLQSKVNQLESDIGSMKSDMAATKEAAQKAAQAANDAKMASEKMQSSYNKSMRTK